MISSRKPLHSQVEQLARSLAKVLEPLSGSDLIEATVLAILKHRALIEQAEAAYRQLNVAEGDGAGREELHKAYAIAMLNNRAQIAIVAALTDKLGYTPDIPSESDRH